MLFNQSQCFSFIIYLARYARESYFLPVETREPEPQGRLLNKVGVVCAVALVEAVLTLALSVASLKIEFQASFASLCKLCEAVTRGGNLSVACGI